MKIYKEDEQTILLSQFNDPLMDHLYKKILFHLRKSRGKKLLDIGCGAGKIAYLTGQKGFDVTGIEIERRVAKLAESNLGESGVKGKIIAGDILNLKLNEDFFDVIVCSEVIEHVDEPKKIIKKVLKLLKEGGLFILTTPHNQKYWTVSDEYADHKKRFGVEEIKKLLSDFRIVSLYTVGFPGMVSLMLFYNFVVKLFKLQHNASWRKKRLESSLFYSLVTVILKIDDFFNYLNLGLDIIVVAIKKK